jgi:hypothetical protein
MNDMLDAGQAPEELAAQMRRGAGAWRGKRDSAAALLGEGDEVRDRLRRRAIRHHHEVAGRAQQADRRKIRDDVIGELLIKMPIDRLGGAAEQQRVAVGSGPRHQLGADVGAGPSPVLDDDLPAPNGGQPVADDAGDQVSWSAGRERHDQAHEPGRPDVGPRAAGRQHGSARRGDHGPAGEHD